MMSLSDTSENEYFTEIALRATDEGFTCHRFIPSNIDPNSKTIKGKTFHASSLSWIEDTFSIPQVLYDRCYYSEDSHSKHCLQIVSWLKTHSQVNFLGYGLPNKFTLYNVLKQSPLCSYIPFTKLVSEPSKLLGDLAYHKGLVLKPINGSQGIGIYYLEQLGHSIVVKTFTRQQHIHKEFSEEKKFLAWVQSLLNKKDYLVQPYLELNNQNNEPFDIRVLLQKEVDGRWAERGRGIRLGPACGILSNLSAGGTVQSFDTCKEFLAPPQIQYLSNELSTILHHIPRVLEEAFLPLFELGIDIGVAKNGSIWILDINSKPGRKVILETNPVLKDVLYRAPLLYANTLDSTVKHDERTRLDAKTLSY
jgi:glutathione synthase/RimK-type ligase-like ATP-grasp enzyme